MQTTVTFYPRFLPTHHFYVCFWSQWNMHYIGGTVVNTIVHHVAPVRYNNNTKWFSESRILNVFYYEAFRSLTEGENLFDLPSTLPSLSCMCAWFLLGSDRGFHERERAYKKRYIFFPLR